VYISVWKCVFLCLKKNHVLKEVSYTHQGCIHLFKNPILWNIEKLNIITIWNNCFLFENVLKCNLYLWCKAEFFSIITPVFSVILQKSFWYADLLLKKHFLLCLIIINHNTFCFRILWWTESLKEHLFEIEIFCNNVTVSRPDHYKRLYCHFWSIVIHSSWIKNCLYCKKKTTTKKHLTSVVYIFIWHSTLTSFAT